MGIPDDVQLVECPNCRGDVEVKVERALNGTVATVQHECRRGALTSKQIEWMEAQALEKADETQP